MNKVDHLETKRKKKDVKLFLSIYPLYNQINMNYISNDLINYNNHLIYYPRKIYSNKFNFIIEEKDYFMNFYESNKDTFSNILSNTFYAISLDKNFNSFRKSIINLIELKNDDRNDSYFNSDDCICQNEEMAMNGKRVFITNYSFIKWSSMNKNDILIYFLPRNKNKEISNLNKKLDYVVKSLKEKEERLKYFEHIKINFDLQKLEIDQKFLKLRSEIINFTMKERNLNIYKDPVKRFVIYPKLDILILNYKEINELSSESIISNSINISNLDVLTKNNFNNKYINFVSYLDSTNLYKNFRDTFNIDNMNQTDLFVDKDFSVNFGKIENFGNLALGKYYFSMECPGSFIYDQEFSLIGISSTQTNNISIANQICSFDSEINIPQNFNIILPFTNIGVVLLFKKYLEIDVDMSILFKKNIFTVVNRLNSPSTSNLLINNFSNPGIIIDRLKFYGERLFTFENSQIKNSYKNIYKEEENKFDDSMELKNKNKILKFKHLNNSYYNFVKK